MALRTQQLPPGFLVGCVALFAFAVAGTIHFCHTMDGGMLMPGGWMMSMMWMPMPGCGWSASAATFLLMWLAMMIAMMLPSALPMLLSIRRSSAENDARNFEARAWFAATGYFFIWVLIGAVVYALGVAFATATMREPWLSRLTPTLSGIALMLAGLVQFTHWKMSALQRCRAPDCGTTFACGICCAGPMLALLALGAMNLTLMFIIAVVIAMEKLLPHPERSVRLFGIMALVTGLGILARQMSLS